MKRLMVLHTMPPEALSLEKIQEVEGAMRQEPEIRGYRSFLNLTEGRIVCLIDAPDAETLGAYFRRAEIPFDRITEVEIEGERGQFTNLRELAAASVGPGL
jgi:hypothetical protein